MKQFLKITFTLFLFCLTQTLQAQTVDFLTSENFKPDNLTDLNYIIAGQQDEVEWKKDAIYFIDFQVVDNLKAMDSIHVVINGKTYSHQFLTPFILSSLKNNSVIEISAFQAGKEVGFVSQKGAKFELKIQTKVKPFFIKDTVVFGLLCVLLAFVFYTAASGKKGWQKFYRVIPSLLLCYLLPAIFNSLGLISNEYSGLYGMAKDYLLPAALVLMTLGIDFKGLVNLGPKAIIMFLTATFGIIVGGPLAIIIYKYIDPAVVGGIGNDATWRGMATLAGSWIGGGANQAAMLETYKYNPDLYGKMVTVDIVVANIWMSFLLWAASRSEMFDKWLRADSSSIDNLKTKLVNYQSSIQKYPTVTDYIVILGIVFGIVGASHFFGDDIAAALENSLGSDSPFASSFFWIVVLATTGGLIISLTKWRKYEGAGASKIGSVFIYLLVATIGMNMELAEAFKEPQLLLVGIIWMLIHIVILFAVARLIKAPFFFVAVGSKANVGGAASAPVVASAFHPSLASVGAILAVLGYALGTYGAILSAQMMQAVAP